MAGDNVVVSPGVGGAVFRSYLDAQGNQHGGMILEYMLPGGVPNLWPPQYVSLATPLPVLIGDGANTVLVDSFAKAMNVAHKPTTSGGPSKFKVATLATLNAASIKNTPGQLYGWYLFNNTAQARYVKFYDMAGVPAPGPSTVDYTVTVPPTGGTNVNWDKGVPYVNGIGVAITGGVAENDNTITGVNDVTGVILFK